MGELKSKCEMYTSLIDNSMKKQLDKKNVLFESIDYSVFAGGKRLRPLIMFAVGENLGIKAKEILPFAVAMEFIHTYSLVHDDLPAMDNDDLRRGKPTNHIVYGEGMAILAGDGLLNYAMEILLENSVQKFDINTIKATKQLFDSSGVSGMILGQAYDIKNENTTISINELKQINELKTGKLIESSFLIPAILKNSDDNIKNKLQVLAKKIGLAYQIKDDLLDIYGEDIGKDIGSDEKNCKNTYPSIMGLDETEIIYDNLISEIYEILNTICVKEDFLYLLVEKILFRKV